GVDRPVFHPPGVEDRPAAVRLEPDHLEILDAACEEYDRRGEGDDAHADLLVELDGSDGRRWGLFRLYFTPSVSMRWICSRAARTRSSALGTWASAARRSSTKSAS